MLLHEKKRDEKNFILLNTSQPFITELYNVFKEKNIQKIKEKCTDRSSIKAITEAPRKKTFIIYEKHGIVEGLALYTAKLID